MACNVGPDLCGELFPDLTVNPVNVCSFQHSPDSTFNHRTCGFAKVRSIIFFLLLLLILDKIKTCLKRVSRLQERIVPEIMGKVRLQPKQRRRQGHWIETGLPNK